MLRSLVLFAHIVGMLTLFVGLSFESLSLESLRRSSTRFEASPWVRMFGALPRVYGIAFGLILISGIYLAARADVYALAWVRISFGAMLLMGVVGGPLIRSRVRALQQASDEHRNASDTILRASLRTRVALGLAIVYLMIGKPGIGNSLLVIGLALIFGVAASFPHRRVQSPMVGS
jgi:hypothetical protein